MSWLFSQALVEEFWAENCLDGEPSAPSSGNPTQLAYLSPDRMTDFSRLSRFGMTFKPLTADRGEELLMSYLAGFHAKTLAQPDEAQELTESAAECGEKWRGSFAKYDPNTSLWRTHQCSLLGGLDEFSVTWPQWGLMRDGECWERPMSAHRTSATEFGSLPNGETFFHTPNTTGLDGGSNSRKALKKRMQKWTTPTAHNAKETNAPSESLRNTPTLAAQAGGHLNPTWVEWLMGWPLDWTDLKRLETDKFLIAQRQLGKSFQKLEAA